MKKFNEKLNKDIVRLKELHARMDKTAFMKERNKVMKKHQISKYTVYKQMRKNVPGLEHSSSWGLSNSPITEEEILMVHEMLVKQTPLSDIRICLERYYGDNYPFRRVNRIRKEIDKRNWDTEGKEPAETNFGKTLRMMFIEYSMIDLIEPSRVVTLKLGDMEYKVSCRALKDSLDMIIYSAENGGKDAAALNRLNMQLMLTRKMDHAIKGQHVNMYDLRILESIRRSLEAGARQAISSHPDSRVLAEVCRELKPGISDVEINLIADKHKSLVKGSSEDIVPFSEEIRDLTAQVALANM
jgi:hypothetical protein